ncbi:MAG: hypothetical protein JNN17_02480 [Verrucomicrobiaceae bacterium]|nr:hypothetical protein [Verrucomicrobiaceae bacterium]
MNSHKIKQILKLPACLTRSIIGLTLMISMSSCQFNAPYDDKTDAAITELAKETEKFVARCDVERVRYSKAGTFYTDATGSIKAIKDRSGLYLKNEREIEALNRLETKFERLKQSHQEGPITSSLAEPIRVSFRSLQQMQIAKKRSLAVSKSIQEQ